jgi:hypothetical protein
MIMPGILMFSTTPSRNVHFLQSLPLGSSIPIPQVIVSIVGVAPPQSPPAHSIQPSNPREVRCVILPPHDDDGVLDVAIDPVSR